MSRQPSAGSWFVALFIVGMLFYFIVYPEIWKYTGELEVIEGTVVEVTYLQGGWRTPDRTEVVMSDGRVFIWPSHVLGIQLGQVHRFSFRLMENFQGKTKLEDCPFKVEVVSGA